MDQTSALQARLATTLRQAGTRTLTLDNTVRGIALGPGGWHVHGSTTQGWIATRYATDDPADGGPGTLKTGEVAPTTGELAASAAGSAGTADAWDDAQTVTGVPLPATAAEYIEIGVPAGQFVNLYLRTATSTTVLLVGPFA